jgi:PAS domain S-box-containing protein
VRELRETGGLAALAELRRLMHEVAAAPALEAVYQAALACLKRALSVERASILVFDDAGVMRFVAWAGLSPGYRAVVEGHSPWAREDKGARTIGCADVATDPSLAAYRALFAREEIAALAFVPLVFGDALLGKLMLYYPTPHRFSDEELLVAETIAGHLAFAIAHHRDVGGLARAEQRARDHEEHLRLALAAGRAGIWEWDPASGTVSWSPELEAQHGLSPGSFEGTFAAFQRDIHPDDRERVLSTIQRTLDGGNEYALEYRIVVGEETRWLAAQGHLLRDASGAPRRMLGVCAEITARKRQEERNALLAEAGRVLARSLDADATLAQLARLLVPRMADWFVVHTVHADGSIRPARIDHADPDKVAMAWRAVERWPTRPDAPLGAGRVIRSGEPQLIEEVTPEQLALTAEDPEHGRLIADEGFRSAMTVPLWVRDRVIGALSLATTRSPRRYDAEDLAFAAELARRAATALDNARLFHEAEAARRTAEASAERLGLFARVSAHLADALDPDDVLARLTDFAVAHLADYAVAYAREGDHVRRAAVAHADPDKRNLVEALAHLTPPTLEDREGAGAVLRTSEPVLAAEIPRELLEQVAEGPAHLALLQQLAPRSCIIVPLRARGKTIAALALAATDGSGRRYGESELALAEELAERAALLLDNARLHHEARRALRGRDELLAVVSHDLRNPINAIVMSCHLLETDPPADRRTRSHGIIRRAAQQMTRLLEDLLDAARIDEGRLTLDRAPVDVTALVNEAIALHTPLAEEKRLTLTERTAVAPLVVDADRDRLLQALSNLLGNALKFTPPGGTISIETGAADGAAAITVRDSGPGIAAEQLPHLFDRFWQGDRTRRDGLGLGLAIARGIAEAHQGAILVESAPGRGAAFTLRLPLVAVPEVAEVPAARRQRILVVDDDEDFRREVIDLLASHGHTVIGAAHGREALAHLEAGGAPDLILLDLMMPVMDGWELFAALKDDPALREVPLVVMTCADRDRVGPALEGAVAFLPKPFTRDRLLALMQRAERA